MFPCNRVLSAARALALNEFIEPLTQSQRRSPVTLLGHCGHIALHSNAHNINANLTAEEAIMRGVVLREKERLLLMYRNDPCIVVGRNQNLFAEVAMRRAARERVVVARRSSGGGAVYQDWGNLCFSFFTHRNDYAPEKTIQILRHGLCALYGVKPDRLTTTKRYDLYLDGKKISGSAMRVQRDIAFHHCTLLVNTPVDGLGAYLREEGAYIGFRTSSVGSVRSPVTSLAHEGFASTTDTAVTEVEAFMAGFFCSHGPFIANHAAPWELSLDTILAQPTKAATPTEEAVGTGASLLIDVASLMDSARSDSFLTGDTRRASTTDCATCQEEVARLASMDWCFAMPPFTTIISLTLEDVCEAMGGAVDGALLSALFAANATSGCEKRGTTIFIEATVEKRCVTSVAVASGPAETVFVRDKTSMGELRDHGSLGAVTWLENFLGAVLVGTPCDAPPAEWLCDADGPAKDALLQGLRMELTTAATLDDTLSVVVNSMDEETQILNTVLDVVQAVVTLWRRKNVFDYRDGC